MASHPPSVSVVSDKTWVPQGTPWLPVLFHAWGIPDPAGVPELDCYSRLRTSGPSGIRLVDWDTANFVLLPFDWSHTKSSSQAFRTAVELALKARASHKSLLAFYWSDDERPVSLPNTVFFRTSIRR